MGGTRHGPVRDAVVASMRSARPRPGPDGEAVFVRCVADLPAAARRMDPPATLWRFFTAWSLALAALPVYPPWRRATALLVSVTGGYITYVHPRRLGVPVAGAAADVYLTGPALRAGDALVHHLPLLLLGAAWWWGCERRPFLDGAGCLLAALLLAAFAATHDVGRTYDLRARDVAAVALVLALPLGLALAPAPRGRPHSPAVRSS
jgi:hypothetical protein